jgi:hypothetical protein
VEASKEAEMEDLKKRLLNLRKERRKLEKELESTIDEYFPPLTDGSGKAEAEAVLVEDKKLYYERMGKLLIFFLYRNVLCDMLKLCKIYLCTYYIIYVAAICVLQ